MSFRDINLDGSLNMSSTANLNASGTFPGMMPSPMNLEELRRLTPEQLMQLQMINQQQIQQLAAQMANVQVAGTTPEQTVLPTASPLVSPTSPTAMTGQIFQQQQVSYPTSQTGLPAQFIPVTGYTGVNNLVPLSPPLESVQNAPSNVSNNVFSQASVNNSVTIPNNTVGYPNSLERINGQMGSSPQIPLNTNNTIGVNINGPLRNATVPNNLPLQQKNMPRGYSNSTYSSSSASTPQDSPRTPQKHQNQKQTRDEPDGPTFMHRPRQMVTSPPSGAPPPMSDASSTSSASIPGSPHSIQSPDSTWSDVSPGPTSPDYLGKVVLNGDIRSPTSVRPIQNKPLQMQTRYPQDKCYACMKKVYPMEKLGPVRGVVYHKGCFRCKVCRTQLTLKNFFHSQSDQFDLAVYCKSHQPIATDKGSKLDSESFEIRSALNAPKQSRVLPESERVPVKGFHMDMNSREIEHARKVPVVNLQPGNKVRNTAWSKSKRDVAKMPPEDVVRHDSPVPEYDPVSYNVHQVETNPDY